MTEEIIVQKFEVPEDRVIELAKALLMDDERGVEAICSIIEKAHYQTPDSQQFFSIAAGIATSMPEKRYSAFKARLKQEIERPDVPSRVQMFYRCLL